MQTRTRNLEKVSAHRRVKPGAEPAQSHIETLPLAQIRAEAPNQVRAVIHPSTVAEYARAMKDPRNHFPPVVVFKDGGDYILADGFHRLAAARQNGSTKIEAEVHSGTHEEALRHGLSANVSGGLPRTYKDKRRAVALAVAQWPELSTRELARICGVSDPFVASWRRKGQSLELETPTEEARRPRFTGPTAELPDFGDEHAEAKRLKYLAETWPATCKHCDQEFRYEKTQREPASCPACATVVRECKLCGRPFEPQAGKEFCSRRCAIWFADHAVNGAN